MTDRTGTLLRLVAEAYDDFELYRDWPCWGATWHYPDGCTARYRTADDALLAALEHHWAKQ